MPYTTSQDYRDQESPRNLSLFLQEKNNLILELLLWQTLRFRDRFERRLVNQGEDEECRRSEILSQIQRPPLLHLQRPDCPQQLISPPRFCNCNDTENNHPVYYYSHKTIDFGIQATEASRPEEKEVFQRCIEHGDLHYVKNTVPDTGVRNTCMWSEEFSRGLANGSGLTENCMGRMGTWIKNLPGSSRWAWIFWPVVIMCGIYSLRFPYRFIMHDEYC